MYEVVRFVWMVMVTGPVAYAVEGQWETKEQCRASAIETINQRPPEQRSQWVCQKIGLVSLVPASAEKLELN